MNQSGQYEAFKVILNKADSIECNSKNFWDFVNRIESYAKNEDDMLLFLELAMGKIGPIKINLGVGVGFSGCIRYRDKIFETILKKAKSVDCSLESILYHAAYNIAPSAKNEGEFRFILDLLISKSSPIDIELNKICYMGEYAYTTLDLIFKQAYYLDYKNLDNESFRFKINWRIQNKSHSEDLLKTVEQRIAYLSDKEKTESVNKVEKFLEELHDPLKLVAQEYYYGCEI